MRAVVLGLALAAGLHAATLGEGVVRLIASSPAAHNAFWGIQIVDLTTGKTLFEQNAGHFFVPASNAKLFSTALALTRLGPEHTFQTRVTAGQAPDAEGRIAGSLRLIGGGDPNLSARPIPYRRGPVTGDPLVVLAELADQIVARGVKRIEGDVVGDDSFYVWEPYANGWSVDDPTSDDGAPVSALTIHDNVLTLRVRPGAAAGEPAALTLDPPVEYYNIDNRVRTVAAGERRIRVERLPGSFDVRIWGTVPLRDKGRDELLGIDDPARYAAKALKQLLEQRGVTVTGSAVAHHLYPEDVPDLRKTAAPPDDRGIELASHTSAPLLEDLRITDKVSQNLHAELALRAVARSRRNVGSFEAGREEMRTFLGEIGVEAGAYTLFDGSGLSRLDLVTPGTVVKLLRHMYGSPQRANWISLLPVGGQDGTLASRFGENPPVAPHVHAKTGSLSHVSALSGYVERAAGHWVAFSILVNNYNGPAGEIHAVMDRICALIME